eukprot:2522451-Pleurochrysis_carterae.AAC.3
MRVIRARMRNALCKEQRRPSRRTSAARIERTDASRMGISPKPVQKRICGCTCWDICTAKPQRWAICLIHGRKQQFHGQEAAIPIDRNRISAVPILSRRESSHLAVGHVAEEVDQHWERQLRETDRSAEHHVRPADAILGAEPLLRAEGQAHPSGKLDVRGQRVCCRWMEESEPRN